VVTSTAGPVRTGPAPARAEEILAAAGVAEDPGYYGAFTDEREKAVLAVPQLIQAAWAANDADMFARVFTADGSLLMREDQLTSQEEIRTYMAAGFRGAYKGARVTGWPLAVTFLNPEVAVAVTQGGIILAGEEAVEESRAIRATWVLVAQGGTWKLLSHHSSPLGTTAPPPDRHTEAKEDTMSSDSVNLVAQAKQWAGNYGKYSNGVEGAVLTAPLRARAAWDRNDADAFADLFTDNGSMLANDNQLTSRDQIRSYLTEAFAGPLQGSRLADAPVDIRLLTEDVALAVTEGGVLYAGETEPAEDRRTRSTWVAARRDGDWRLVSYQSSPVTG
jgi:uncharacterized protein (TIGR02246 family)